MNTRRTLRAQGVKLQEVHFPYQVLRVPIDDIESVEDKSSGLLDPVVDRKTGLNDVASKILHDLKIEPLNTVLLSHKIHQLDKISLGFHNIPQ